MDIFELDKKSRLKFLFDEAFKVGKSIDGMQSNDRLEYAVGLFIRQIYNSYTLWCICNPVARADFFGENEILHDFASGFVVSRSMYETVLIANYILLTNDFEHSKNVVIKVARLHSLVERDILSQNMKSSLPKAKELKVSIPSLKRKIFEHEEFVDLPENVKNYVDSAGTDNWNWHGKKMPELAELAGFHPSWHLQIYNYLSNYAHANSLSVEQVGAVNTADDAIMLADIIYDFAENFLSRSIDILVRVCKSEGIDIMLSTHTLKLINSWKNINKWDMARKIDE